MKNSLNRFLLPISAFVVACFTVSCRPALTFPVSTPAARNFVTEREILQSMIHQHKEAVEMAGKCLTKAPRPELAAFCRHLSEDHQATLRLLATWWSQW